MPISDNVTMVIIYLYLTLPHNGRIKQKICKRKVLNKIQIYKRMLDESTYSRTSRGRKTKAGSARSIEVESAMPIAKGQIAKVLKPIVRSHPCVQLNWIDAS